MKKIRISKLLLLLFTAVILMSTNVNAKREEININGTKYNWCSTNGNSDGEKSNMNAIKKKSTIITSSDMKQEHPDVIYTPKFYIPGAGYYIYDSNNNLKDSWISDDFYHEVTNLADGMYKVKIAKIVSGYDFDFNVDIINPYADLEYIEDTQKNCLWEINVTGKKNDEQLQKVLEYYPQIVEKLDKKKCRNKRQRADPLLYLTKVSKC